MPKYGVYINYINRNGSNVTTSFHFIQASSESEAKQIATSKINGKVISAKVVKEGN